ncbi:MAG: hypothetical protein KDH89_11255 [Anaerolineae bacterium]|nr:hypothetical protein [Anaerolineae bacterium]
MNDTQILPPTIADVQRIAALDDPVVRNLQITQCYHDLSRAMARLTGPGANWCTVATWASNQAGRSIRKEDLRATFERLLRRSDDATRDAQAMAAQGAEISGDETRSLAGAVDALRDALSPVAAFDRTADAVARGNRKVFEEIALQFARFLALFADGKTQDEALTDFYDVLQPGEPPDGQRYLRQAFEHYTGALAAGDDKERAELLLLANLEIGFHEQTRLQPEILEAMDAPIYDPALLRSRLLDELFPDRPSRLRLTVAELFGRADTLIAARDRLADEAQRISRLAVTELMMTLELPVNRVLRLGKPLPDAFPPELQDIDNDALRALLAQVAPVDAGAVEDWSRLPERMRFISDLFRTYHLDAALFDPPFTTEQLAMISEGRRPDDL